MCWTNRSEAKACCPGDGGPVADAESVARLIHSRTLPPEHVPLKRSEMFPKANDRRSNVCGSADGSSVIRCDGLRDEELIERSIVQASLKPDREATGAWVACVAHLRQIRTKVLPEEKLVFVYDDPSDVNQEHAVVRGRDDTSKARQSEIMNAVQKAFQKKIGLP